MASGIQNGMFSSKDFEIKSLDLINSGGQTISLINTMVELLVHQSIDAGVMFGSLLLVDGNDLFNNFYLCGNEYLNVVIDQPSLDAPIKKTFRIYKVSNRTNNNNAGAKYILYFTSNEAILSSSTVVSKAYKNKRLSDIVVDILRNVLNVTPKKINRLEITSGQYDIVIPSYRPLEAIQWVASRSYTSSQNYCYYFFESRDGFEFVSQQTLFKQNPIKNLIYDIKNTNETPNQSSDVSKNKNSLEKMRILEDFDMIKSASNGAFASRLLSVNLMTQQFNYNDYVATLAASQNRLLNKYMPINDQKLMQSTYSNFKTYISTNSTKQEKENSVELWLMNRQMHKNLLENFRVKGVLSGDITLKAGDIVNLKFPKYVAADSSGKQFDQYRSGKYLVADITHKFNNTGVFETIVELVSDSISSPLPTGKDFAKVVI